MEKVNFAIYPGFLLESRKKLEGAFFREITAEGFDRIGLFVYPGHFQNQPAEVAELEKLCRRYGVGVEDVHCELAALDGKRQGEVRKIIMEDLHLTARLKACCLVIHSAVFARPDTIIKDEKGNLYPQFSVWRDIEDERSGMKERIKEGLADYAGEAKKLGVKIAVETADRRMNGMIAEFVRDVDPGTCGVCLDTGPAQLDSGAVELAQMLGPRVICTHLNDNDGKEDLHLPPFKGIIDWPGVISSLVRAGYKGTYAFECLRGTMADIISAREKIEHLVKKFGGANLPGEDER